jgi:hypothetical protein
VIWVWIALGVLAAVVIVGLAARRYGERPGPQPGWEPTDEVFNDPSTGRFIRVWIEPADGTRHYVPEDHPPRAGDHPA